MGGQWSMSERGDGGRLRSLRQRRLKGAAAKPVKLRVVQSTRRALNTSERLTMKSLSETQSKDPCEEHGPWEGTHSSQPNRSVPGGRGWSLSGQPGRGAVSQGTSSCSVFHSSFGTGLQSSPRTDSSKVNELSKLFVHAFIVKGSKSQRMKEHELTSVNDVQDGEERNGEKLRYWSGETNIHTGR